MRPVTACLAAVLLGASLPAQQPPSLAGRQPPVTIHGAQADVHYGDEHHGNQHESDQQNCHGDLDLDLDTDGLAKSFKPDLPAIAPHNACALAISTLVVVAPITSAGDATGTDPPHTRPPPRAPPSILL